MAKIKHIAISTQDVDATARFYVDVLGLKEIQKLDTKNATGYYLSDGNINLAILNFKNDQVAGAERGRGYSGIHHIGFQVEDDENVKAKLEEANFAPRDDINAALGIGMDGAQHANVEVKYNAPDGVVIDISHTGWVGTSGDEVPTPATRATA
jgi:catechol 2,3-dioxygenase-like lactoylglutathione lyase family enzyme